MRTYRSTPQHQDIRTTAIPAHTESGIITRPIVPICSPHPALHYSNHSQRDYYRCTQTGVIWLG